MKLSIAFFIIFIFAFVQNPNTQPSLQNISTIEKQYPKWKDSLYIYSDIRIKNEIIDTIFSNWQWKKYKILNPFYDTNSKYNVLIVFSDLFNSSNEIPNKFLGITQHIYSELDSNEITKSIVILNINSLSTWDEVYETLAHEIGHVLLDNYHSSDSLDMMYHKKTMITKYTPTNNDLTELKKRYPEETIILNHH